MSEPTLIDTPEGVVALLAEKNPEAVLWEPRQHYDAALVGVTEEPNDAWDRPRPSPMVAVYDRAKLQRATIAVLGMRDDDPEAADAADEWNDFNVLGSWLGPSTPTVWPPEADDTENDDGADGEPADAEGEGHQ